MRLTASNAANKANVTHAGDMEKVWGCLTIRSTTQTKKGQGSTALRKSKHETYFVAMPEHLAKVFNATLSPRRINLMGPRTMAHWVIGVIAEPSATCHSTL